MKTATSLYDYRAIPKKILVLRGDGIGDFIMSIPAMTQLRQVYKDAHIVLFSCNWQEPLARASGLFDEIISWDQSGNYYLTKPKRFKYLSFRAFRFLRKIRRYGFDLAIDFKSDPRNRLIMWLCGIKVRFGFDKGLFRQLLNYRIPYQRNQHESKCDLMLANAVSGEQFSGQYIFVIPDEDKRKAELFLGESGFINHDKLVVIHPVARWPAKMWPKLKSAQLADRLLSLSGVKVVFVGAAEDLAQINQIKALMKHRPIVSAGSLNFLQMSALIQRSSVFIGNDAAPMHISGLLNIPTIALFGPTDPNLTRPFGSQTTVIRKIMDKCSKCFRHNIGNCVNPGSFCMDLITVDEVFNQCLKYLNGDKD